MSPQARQYDWALTVLAEKRRYKKKIPDSVTRIVESRPQLFPWLQFDLDSFWHLSRSRPVHFGGVGYIPDEAIDGYIRLYRLEMEQDDREDFIRNLMVLDAEYLKIQHEQQQAGEGKDGDKDKSGDPPPRQRKRGEPK
jgi:hypothetical protein